MGAILLVVLVALLGYLWRSSSADFSPEMCYAYNQESAILKNRRETGICGDSWLGHF